MLTWILLALACGPSSSEPPAQSTPTLSPPQEELPPTELPDRIAARHLVVTYDGAAGADRSISRTSTQARARAQEALSRLQSGESFSETAKLYSDGPSAARGGMLGAFDRGVMDEAFEDAAVRLRVGEFSGVVESPFGFHVILREQLEEVRISHVLVQWKGVRRSTVDRTREAADERARLALEKLHGGTPLTEVALELSDGPMGKRGGELGWFQRGQMVPMFDEVAFQLAVGETSDIVETPLGLHIIKRLE